MDFQYGILHNRKTAGTALKDMIAQQQQISPIPVHCFGHAMTLPQFVNDYPHAKAIFFVRDPISKFVSGFYSRLREGQPRYYFPWSSAEKRAFKYFEHPNELAEALSAWNPFRRYAAFHAMRSIGHVKHTLVAFLGTPTFLQQHARHIAFIGHQPDFVQDINYVRRFLQMNDEVLPPDDAVRAHRNPSDADRYLSERAINNLYKWYTKDFEIYAWCLAEREKIIAGRK